MILAWVGLIMGLAAVVVGAALEGLHLEALVQPTAALIVCGGTLGATMLASSQVDFMSAIKSLKKVFLGKPVNHTGLIEQLLDLAKTARKDGLIALDGKLGGIDNEFITSNLRQIIDGYDPKILEDMMDERIYIEEGEKGAAGKVWETAGGFAPTVGIIGAVLGLIHVMGNLNDSSKLGSGIAVAFVATVYGVGLANLIFIPIGNRIKKMGLEESVEKELIKIGLMGILNGLNPRVIEDQLYNIIGVAKPDAGGGGGEMKAAA